MSANLIRLYDMEIIVSLLEMDLHCMLRCCFISIVIIAVVVAAAAALVIVSQRFNSERLIVVETCY